ncbi:MAG: DUF374 domain-containing protein [bacterium]|nr:DUF374 domain-containing protein [bacterium]
MSGGQRLKLALAPVGWRILSGAWRMEATGATLPAGGPLIFACLHRDILPSIVHVRDYRPVLLVSTSPDGEILVRTLANRGYGFVRGASGENGGRAFVLLKQALAAGRHVGIAVDGPEGPYGVVQPGVLRLAQVAGVPIVPLRAEARHAKQLATWDRTVVPWPGTRVVMHHGQSLHPGPAASATELETSRDELASFLAGGEESV